MCDPAGALLNWLNRHATALQALAAVITTLVAVAALVAIPMQINASARLQNEQSARDIYRAFLALSVEQPAFAEPDYCALSKTTDQHTAYRYYVEFLLYTAEQVTETSKSWEPAMQNHLKVHMPFMCNTPGWQGEEAPIAKLIGEMRTIYCPIPVC
ncbi:hypothetical protein [Sulfitobacter aestuariivivens]|uniref:Uncharacterized protein n=1 Tax=Sulfitobacter aestuariivivens TaxID=2766981 RepID=A0A927D1T3_9RHOB|nr:hypothetical protein [Sulfitobacter aestuariivivens]MBD3663513.1 hypothetical protein [Sulfitobacter aestuariivivens]